MRSKLLLAFVVACSPAAESTHAPPNPEHAMTATADAGAPKSACESVKDLRALLARHAEAFGTAEAVASALPKTFDGEVAMAGKTGTIRTLVARGRFRETVNVAGMTLSTGVDGEGAWVAGAQGVPYRVSEEEALEPRLDSWIRERKYLAALVEPSAGVDLQCKDDRVTIETKLHDLGDPTLVFDAASASLQAVRHTTCDGRQIEVAFRQWSFAEQGVRWPLEVLVKPELGSPIQAKVTKRTSGLGDCTGDACFAPPSSSLGLSIKGASARVPMAFYLDELSIRAKVKGREVFALLDSGAGLSAVDATTPLGAAFKPALTTEGSGSTQKVQIGIGEIEDFALGGLTARRLPVASVPIPALDAYGARRPELIAGFSLFLSDAVRVDYAKGEVVFASDASTLHDDKAQRVPLRVWDGKPMAEVEIEGVRGMMEIDTGNGGGFDVFKRWADAHGVLEHHATLSVRGLFGAGTQETSQTMWRMKRGSLGPIVVDDRVAKVDDPPSSGIVAGLLGNQVLSRCAAIVLDVPGRALWLVPPCDRRVPEDLSGWRLVKSAADPKLASTPWTIGTIVPGGSADRAEIKVGDRLISVAGKPAVLDIPSFASEVERPAGTKVAVVVEREGKRLTKSMELVRVLAAQP